MPNATPAESVLTLFTTPDRALSITGDLAEEARSRGPFWFWAHVVRTTMSLFWRDFATAPARMAVLGTLGLLMFVGLTALGVLNDEFLFNRLFGEDELGRTRMFFWFFLNGLLTPYLVGIVLAHLAPDREMTCVGAAVIALEMLNCAVFVWFVSIGIPVWWPGFVFGMHLMAGASALTAGARQRQRVIFTPTAAC